MMKPLMPVEDALEHLLNLANPISTIENIPLRRANARVLATPVIANLTQPPFNSSAMDGYALCALEDVPEGATFILIGTSAAGHAFEGKLQLGQAIRIYTGAPVPDDATTVIIQENVQKPKDDTIHCNAAIQLSKNIRAKGQDFTTGQELLPRGRKLNFTDLTLAAAANNGDLSVYKKPLVGILSTGDELVTPGSMQRNNSQIISSNSFGIAAIAENAGADVIDFGIVPDNLSLLRKAIRNAKESGVNVLVTSGGASVGDHDLVQKALTDEGMKLEFWRIAMRPGKPLMVGSIDGMIVIGLPGNPVASMVCSLVFLEPLIHKLSHSKTIGRIENAILHNDLNANDLRQDYLRAKIIGKDTEKPIVQVFEKQDSSVMKILADSDCLLIRRSHAPYAHKGQECEIIRIRAT